ncbi:hypothetical protein PRI8871_03318 [Pseudoprimorskyibacter insulae]|uniref:DDE domain-containing protein n=1 Tax=Pseudoprimorskyibacter insulae TaxID=1695997 RepID=A0A2R8B036_9RHOB|nr:hypothetical protein PRI8871_03318 [Pseudoprimorskyibacter insulae]
MLAARRVMVDASTIDRWVRKFGPEIRKRAYGAHRSWRGLQWHVDETYIRVGGRWCYLWRAVDQFGQLIDFRLTPRRNAKAARAFRTIRKGQFENCKVGMANEIIFVANLFPEAA